MRAVRALLVLLLAVLGVAAYRSRALAADQARTGYGTGTPFPGS